jgi:hypothetical protein
MTRGARKISFPQRMRKPRRSARIFTQPKSKPPTQEKSRKARVFRLFFSAWLLKLFWNEFALLFRIVKQQVALTTDGRLFPFSIPFFPLDPCHPQASDALALSSDF